MRIQFILSLSTAFLALAPTSSAQIFQINTADVPASPPLVVRFGENVDFADVDLDGDWDVAFALGGDLGNLQDRIWINQGGLQAGSIGVFTDETAARFPIQSKTGRDIEFVDFDGDGDVDIHTSNTATVSNQGNHWWTNLGGKQAGSLGYYQDETAQRWIGLGGTGSSIPPTMLLSSGGSVETFIDWSGDSDFGDLDNDGDMDLVHASYGGAFSGQVPSRIFLNDGDGHFEEFNPSGFQLLGSSLQANDPALWAEGLQQNQSTDSSGSFADIANATTDFEIGDLDGDFDLDLVQGDLNQGPRIFINGHTDTGGTLAFRDRTSALFPAGYATGSGHYEQELGDLDGDGDLDLLGVNYQGTLFTFNDSVLENQGNGQFANTQVLPNSNADDDEGDFLDYDNDGDLDIYIAAFSGNDRVYENLENGSGSYSFIEVANTGLGTHGNPINLAWDADAADLDGDGDYDVMAILDVNAGANYWENILDIPDGIAPTIPEVEATGNQVAATAGSADLPVRAQVYDNAPYYVTWYNDTLLEIAVDGIFLGQLPARSSGGQIFRAELPSNLVGNVEYHFESQDEYGNTGASLSRSYNSSTALNYRNVYGLGTDGSLGALDVDAKSIATDGKTLYVTLSNTPPNTFYVQFVGLAPDGPIAVPGFGFSNLDSGNLIPSLLKLGLTNANGNAVRSLDIPVGIGSGFSAYWQFFTLDGQAGETWASSQGLEVIFLP